MSDFTYIILCRLKLEPDGVKNHLMQSFTKKTINFFWGGVIFLLMRCLNLPYLTYTEYMYSVHARQNVSSRTKCLGPFPL